MSPFFPLLPWSMVQQRSPIKQTIKIFIKNVSLFFTHSCEYQWIQCRLILHSFRTFKSIGGKWQNKNKQKKLILSRCRSNKTIILAKAEYTKRYVINQTSPSDNVCENVSWVFSYRKYTLDFVYMNYWLK